MTTQEWQDQWANETGPYAADTTVVSPAARPRVAAVPVTDEECLAALLALRAKLLANLLHHTPEQVRLYEVAAEWRATRVRWAAQCAGCQKGAA